MGVGVDRYCKYCEQYKSELSFEKGRVQCVSCRNKYKKKYRKENSDKIKEYRKNNKERDNRKGKEYREKNKDKIKEYYKKNKNCIKSRVKKYRKDNRDILNEKLRVYYRDNIKKYLFSAAKMRAKKQNLPFDITIDDIIINDSCPLLEIKMCVGEEKSRYNSFTIDKINPSMGYIKGNIWVISKRANLSKNNSTIEEYEKIVNNLEKVINNGIVKNCYENNINMRCVYNNALRRSKKNNLQFNIDVNYLKAIYPVDGKCVLLEKNMIKSKDRVSDFSISLDRIIPKIGYVMENVMFISNKANRIKSDLTLNEMKMLLKNWKGNNA